MDLLSIMEVFWRRKLFAIPVILLTLAGAFYVLKIKPPVYTASARVLLIAPPAAPTAAQIAANPRLAKINSRNPYVESGNLLIVADSVIEYLTSSGSQLALTSAGVKPGYVVSLSTDFGNPPIINITGNGPSAEQAIHSASVLTQTVEADLYKLQKQQQVTNQYMITTTSIVQPTQAQLSRSGKLRSLLSVLGAGFILLLVVVSMADAIGKRRKGAYSDSVVSAKIRSGDPLLEPRLRIGAGRTMSSAALRSRRDIERG